MHNIHCQKGLTLTELLVSTALIGIVMMGIISIDYATRKAQDASFDKRQVVVLATSAILEQILNDAAKITGDVAMPGVLFRIGPRQTTCFRQDLNPNPDLITPIDFTDDTWVCYDQQGGNPAVHRCTAAPPFHFSLYSF